MRTPDGTISLIDGAIRDYETSGDAMRWSPPEPERSDLRRMIEAGVSLGLTLGAYGARQAVGVVRRLTGGRTRP